MICHRCHEPIESFEAMRAEPVFARSTKHHAYHAGCYAEVKKERQARYDAQSKLPLYCNGDCD